MRLRQSDLSIQTTDLISMLINEGLQDVLKDILVNRLTMRDRAALGQVNTHSNRFFNEKKSDALLTDLRNICRFFGLPQYANFLFSSAPLWILNKLNIYYRNEFPSRDEKLAFVSWLATEEMQQLECKALWDLAIYRLFIMMGIELEETNSPVIVSNADLAIFKRLALRYSKINSDNQFDFLDSDIDDFGATDFLLTFVSCIKRIKINNAFLAEKLSLYYLEMFRTNESRPLSNALDFVIEDDYSQNEKHVLSPNVTNNDHLSYQLEKYFLAVGISPDDSQHIFHVMLAMYPVDKRNANIIINSLQRVLTINNGLALLDRVFAEVLDEDFDTYDASISNFIDGKNYFYWSSVLMVLDNFQRIESNLSSLSSQNVIPVLSPHQIEYVKDNFLVEAISCKSKHDVEEVYNSLVDPVSFKNFIISTLDLDILPHSPGTDAVERGEKRQRGDDVDAPEDQRPSDYDKERLIHPTSRVVSQLLANLLILHTMSRLRPLIGS